MFQSVFAQFARNLAWALCAGLLLAGCQTPQPPSKAHLTDEQIAALRDLGFHEEQGGWGLDFDGRILFAHNTSKLTDQNRETIEHVVKVLKAVGINRLRVEGYADSRGDRLYNEQLSLRRAEVVAREIDRYGLPYHNITVKGFGVDNPVGDNVTREGRAQNRRVVVIVPVED